MRSPEVITEMDRETYARDGVVCIRGLIPAHWIERLRNAVSEVMENPTEMTRDLAKEAGTAGSFFQELGVGLRHAQHG